MKRALLGLCLAGCARAALEAPTPERVFGAEIPAQLTARLETSEGTLSCALEPRRAPRGTALFVALARGGSPWREQATGAVVTRPLYRGLVFHRTIPGVLAQTGCPLGNGFGQPGYRIPVESHADDAARLALPGTLFFARYTPPPFRSDPSPPPAGHVLGSQFTLGLVSMAHLAGQTTVLGHCDNLAALTRIAAHNERPFAQLRSVTVAAN